METILTPPTEATQESTSPSQQEAESRPISNAEVIELYKKPESEWTEADVELLCRWNAQQQAAERARKEAKEREDAERLAEQRKQQREYWAKIEQKEREAQNDGTIDWFVRQITQKHGYSMPPLRITENVNMVLQYVEKAYMMEVLKRGCTYEADTNTTKIIATVSRWLTTHTKPGLMLRGYIGIGKTTMLYAIRDIISVLLNQQLQIVDARQIAALGRDGAERLKQLTETPLLGIDDLGTEPAVVKSYGNELSPVGELLTQRYNHRRFTIITTNLTTKTSSDNAVVDELQEVYDDRLFDRFKEMFNQLHYDPNQKSYRK